MKSEIKQQTPRYIVVEGPIGVGKVFAGIASGDSLSDPLNAIVAEDASPHASELVPGRPRERRLACVRPRGGVVT